MPSGSGLGPTLVLGAGRVGLGCSSVRLVKEEMGLIVMSRWCLTFQREPPSAGGCVPRLLLLSGRAALGMQ